MSKIVNIYANYKDRAFAVSKEKQFKKYDLP